VGLLGGAKIVKVLLRDYKEVTYASILGLVVGSVISLYPGFAGGIKGILLIGFLLLGAIISYTFSKE
jgi:putative membrane protein